MRRLHGDNHNDYSDLAPLSPTVAGHDRLPRVREDKQVEVLIQQGDLRQPFGVHRNTEAAVHAAFRFQDQMLASGWEKII